jgi:N-acetyl-anhydromuramoyl-L-alanine amidase
MIIDVRTGWLENVTRMSSPNCDARPEGAELSLIVVHGISLPPGQFGGPWIEKLFTNRLPADGHAYFAEIAHLRVSSHVLIRRDGSITQFVPFTARAWHAGESCYRGQACCNDFSVGLELEGTDDRRYEDAQYAALVRLVQALRRTYPSLRGAELVGHCHISPGRKTDPGPAFDWDRLNAELAAVT